MGANPAPKYPGQIPGCTEKPTAQGEPSYADLEERQCFPGFRKTQPGRLLRFSNHSQPKGSGRSRPRASHRRTGPPRWVCLFISCGPAWAWPLQPRLLSTGRWRGRILMGSQRGRLSPHETPPRSLDPTEKLQVFSKQPASLKSL